MSGGFVALELGGADAGGRLRVFVAGRACVRCGQAATTARTRRFGVLAIPQGHCGRCAGRHRLLAIASLLRALIGLATAGALAWLLLAWWLKARGPDPWIVVGLAFAFTAAGALLERARAVRVLGLRKGRALLSFRSQEGARAFLDANGLDEEAVHATLAEAIAGVK